MAMSNATLRRRPRLVTTARDETAALTKQIAEVEREIDERVAALYGVEVDVKTEEA